MMYRFIHQPLEGEPSFPQHYFLDCTSRVLLSQGSLVGSKVSLGPVCVTGQVGTCREATLRKGSGEFFIL